MTKTEIAKMAKDKGFVPQFIGEKETGIFGNPRIPLSYPKEDLRYFLHLCELFYWLSGKHVTSGPGTVLGIENTVIQLLQNKK